MIKMGMRVTWKPQWRDKGDENYTFIAVEDQHPLTGTFGVSTLEGNEKFFLRPIQIGNSADQVESAEPFLPVATFTFLGLERKGARVEMTRTLGDQIIETKIEVIGRADFKRVFRRYAADVRIGTVLIREVQFPETRKTEKRA